MYTLVLFSQIDPDDVIQPFLNAHNNDDQELAESVIAVYDYGDNDETYDEVPSLTGETTYHAGEYTVVIHHGLGYIAAYRPTG